jgi:hypothetical protein
MPDGYQAGESFTVPSGGELRALYQFTDAIYRARSLDDIYTAAL